MFPIKCLDNYCRATLAGAVLSFSLCSLAPATSQAQDWIGPTPMDYANMTTSYTNTLINNAMIDRMVNKRAGTGNSAGRSRATAASRSTSSPATANARPAVFTYTATPAQRNSYRDAYVADLAKSNPKLAASLRTQLGKYDYNDIYAGLLSGTGLSNNNLADAMAAYTVLGWMIVNDKRTDPPAAHVAGVRNQWASALGGTAFERNADRRRQMAEEMKIKMVLLHSGWQDAQKLGQSAAYASTVDGLFRSQMKLKLRGMPLGATGFGG